MTTQDNPEENKVGEALNAQRFRMLEDIARELAGDVVFPTCFDVTLRLRKELQNPDVSIPQIAAVVGVEPLVASKLMRLANSAFYNASGSPVRDVPAAIARLGIKVVRSTTLAIAMGQIVHAKELVQFRDFTNLLWEHTITTAAAARHLARTRTRVNPDEAMLAGLVHDLGAFYMLYRAAQYPELRMRPDTVKHLIMQWHEGIGVTLLNALGLPEEIVEATVDHDRPRPLPIRLNTLSDVVYVANIVAGISHEWVYFEDEEDQAKERTNVFEQIRSEFATIMPEVEADAREIMATFN
ncbi:HDOD domain-containing protein [Propionivibrio limicola]|uniref:HDOD domain-containing protein n=1 Tax=Propionivibrio limicola TaxID=167645 RepID=UPI0012922315|nr:HDOD domain-containing protein [Propionivibrio limicola]